MNVRLRVLDALGMTLSDGDQRVTLRTPSETVAAEQVNGLWTGSLAAGVAPPTLQVDIENSRYFPFTTTFDVVPNPHTGVVDYKRRRSGMAHLVTLDPGLADGIAVVSRLVQVEAAPTPSASRRRRAPTRSTSNSPRTDRSARATRSHC